MNVKKSIKQRLDNIRRGIPDEAKPVLEPHLRAILDLTKSLTKPDTEVWYRSDPHDKEIINELRTTIERNKQELASLKFTIAQSQITIPADAPFHVQREKVKQLLERLSQDVDSALVKDEEQNARMYEWLMLQHLRLSIFCVFQIFVCTERAVFPDYHELSEEIMEELVQILCRWSSELASAKRISLGNDSK